MNKNILYSTAMLLASLTLGACSSDSDDNNDKPAGYSVETVSQAPTWQVDYSGSESRPNWQEPNPAVYENWSIMPVQLEDELKPYASGQDLMALFIGGELRGLTSPAVSQGNTDGDDDKGTFVLKAYGNEADMDVVNLTLIYYCSQLRQTFSRSVQMPYEMGKVYGLEEDLVPQFTLGVAKYPVVTTTSLETIAQVLGDDIQPAAGDMVAAFVGDECRGTVTLDERLLGAEAVITLFARHKGEAFTMKYYNAATSRVYTLFSEVRG